MPMPKRDFEPDAGRSAAPAQRGTAGASPPADLVSTAGPIVFIESPARLLHEQLAARLEAGDAVPDTRWPGAARVGFIVGSSLLLWLAAIGTVTALAA